MNPAPAGFAAGSPYLPTTGVRVVVFPMTLDLPACIAAGIVSGLQAGRSETSGAFTGDVSLAHAQVAGAQYALCGHSERRKYHAESDESVRAQAAAALALGLTPILCVGENDGEDRAAVLARQLQDVTDDERLVIAYEPIWAIGTGKAASAADAQAAAATIRGLGFAKAAVLYGGSVTADNAKDYLSQPDIGGLLIGGASLKPTEFARIVSIAQTLEA